MLRYLIDLEPDDGMILATSRDIPIVTFGANEADAMRRATDAVETVLWALMDEAHDVPIPEYDASTPGPFVIVRAALEVRCRQYNIDRRQKPDYGVA